MRLPTLRPRSFAQLTLALLAACKDDGSSGGFAGEIEFRGEQAFLPGFDYDSGFLPEGSPVSVRATVTAGGGVTVITRATTDGETLTPVAGSGSLAVEGGLTMEVSAKIEVTGAEFEGVVGTFEYAIAAANQTFEPFDASASVASALPAAELGSVPIPGVPGATLVMSVTGGMLTTTYAGSCAEALDGFGQVAGSVTMEGTVSVGATVEIDIPFVITESYGPFPVDVPIPAITSALDLGTRSLATGEAAEPMGICDGAGTGGETDPPMTTTQPDTTASTTMSTTDDTSADTSDTDPTDTDPSDTDPSDTDPTDTDPSDTAVDTSTGDAPSGDPDYPNPYPEGGCPGDTIPVGIGEEPPNAVCLPPCDGGSCPSGATGVATGACIYNPDSSYLACKDDTVCNADETCVDGFCELTPSHCVLLCAADSDCPDTMSCIAGVCSYLE